MPPWTPQSPEDDRDAAVADAETRGADARDPTGAQFEARDRDDAEKRERDADARRGARRRDFSARFVDPRADEPADAPLRDAPAPRRGGASRLRAGLASENEPRDDAFAQEIDAELDRQTILTPPPAPTGRRRFQPPSASRRMSAPLTRLEPLQPTEGASSRSDERLEPRTRRLRWEMSAPKPVPDAASKSWRDRPIDALPPSETDDFADGPAFESQGDDAAAYAPSRPDLLNAMDAAARGGAADATRRSRLGRPAAVAGVAFAAAFAFLASQGMLETDLSGAFTPMAEIAGLAPSEAGRGADVPIDAGDADAPAQAAPAGSRIAGLGAAGPADAQDPAAVGGLDTGAIETASLSGYLDSDALSALIAAAPVKCVLPVPAQGAYGPGVLDEILESGQTLCAETVDYRSEGALFTHRSRIDGEAILEINAPFSIKGDAICHQTTGLSALVIGDSIPLAQAVSLERVVKANYAATPGGEICYRLRPAFSRPGLIAYEADVFVEGRKSVERTDPRPFLMRRRG